MGSRTPLYDTARRRRRAHGRFRRLGHAGQLRLADRGAPRRAPRRRHVRRLAHAASSTCAAPACATSCAGCSPTTSTSSRTPGKALYSCMLSDDGGVIDDLIVYFMRDDFFRLVVNAGTARQGHRLDAAQHAAPFGVDVEPRARSGDDRRAGPERAREGVRSAARSAARAARALNWPFAAGCDCGELLRRAHRLHRRGWLRDHGARRARRRDFWSALRGGRRRAVRPRRARHAAARSRHEPLRPGHGRDHRRRSKSGLAWTVALEPQERDFIGRAALDAQQASGVARKSSACCVEERGVLRAHQKVIVAGVGEGEITSGTFSPTLERSIGFARVPAADRRPRASRYPRQACSPARVVKSAVRAQRQGGHRAVTAQPIQIS